MCRHRCPVTRNPFGSIASPKPHCRALSMPRRRASTGESPPPRRAALGAQGSCGPGNGLGAGRPARSDRSERSLSGLDRCSRPSLRLFAHHPGPRRGPGIRSGGCHSAVVPTGCASDLDVPELTDPPRGHPPILRVKLPQQIDHYPELVRISSPKRCNDHLNSQAICAPLPRLSGPHLVRETGSPDRPAGDPAAMRRARPCRADAWVAIDGYGARSSITDLVDSVRAQSSRLRCHR